MYRYWHIWICLLFLQPWRRTLRWALLCSVLWRLCVLRIVCLMLPLAFATVVANDTGRFYIHISQLTFSPESLVLQCPFHVALQCKSHLFQFSEGTPSLHIPFRSLLHHLHRWLKINSISSSFSKENSRISVPCDFFHHVDCTLRYIILNNAAIWKPLSNWFPSCCSFSSAFNI